MPNKPHPPRKGGGGSRKPTKSAVLDNSEGGHIIFSNAPDSAPSKSKTRKGPPTTDDSIAKGKSKAKDSGEPTAEEAPKKPDIRTLIGGASWTGKLPMALLSEHCQKQKWDKPDYFIAPAPGGFRSGVTLRKRNIKTQESSTLPAMELPPDKRDIAVQPTAAEARHFAAAYTLFRVSSMKNIHMMLPPKYRDLWKGAFQEVKTADFADGKAWMYEADPFVARKDHEEAKVAAAKKREEIAKRRQHDENQPGGSSVTPSGSSSGSGSAGGRMKGWIKVPKVELAAKTRREIEALVRSRGIWNPQNVFIDISSRERITDEVVKLGFRRSHVEEAVEICKDKHEVLEWLLIHCPEDDLPPWALPEKYTAGVSMASGDIKRDAVLARLVSVGYTSELCEEALDRAGGDDVLAASILQAQLLGDDKITHQLNRLKLDAPCDSEVWTEEQAVLNSIYDRKYTSPSPDVCQIEIDVDKSIAVDPIVLTVRRPRGKYPDTLPVVSLQTKLPAYIRLSILKRALSFASENFLGDQMIFNLVDWIERELPDIVSHPGRLSEISAAVDSTEVTAKAHARKPDRRAQAPRQISWTPRTAASLRILNAWNARQDSPQQQKMLTARRSLPAWNLQEAVAATVASNKVTIVSGETGSGKSTQCVQFILDDMIKEGLGDAVNIICTQPRRISAIGLADRVADERCGGVGDEVGYIIRGESKQRVGTTKITFVTTGVLLRRLQTSGGRTEDVVAALADLTHVVVDEVHERSLDTDFLLALLRDVLLCREDLKVILMSATLDAKVFENYFRPVGTVGRIEISGRTYPVDDIHLEDIVRLIGYEGQVAEESLDTAEQQQSIGRALRGIGMRINYDVIRDTVQHIDRQLGQNTGGILIFLPGKVEIDRTVQVLRGMANIYALPLHASLLPAEQRRVFPAAPKGMRKVIASTNVAETSITIEDVVAVIDTGRVKETSYDPQTNMVRLEEVWASRAACKQRRGRAGRVRAGTCYKLYTRNAEAKMAERPEPEIRRVPLEQLCLSVKAVGVEDVRKFLGQVLTPPDNLAVHGAIEVLRRMGALDGDKMTALGRHLAMIPADLRCSKLLVYGATFGCLEPCLTVAAALTVRSPFMSPQLKRAESKAAKLSFGRGDGDLMADVRAFDQFTESRSKGVPTGKLRGWCDANFLSWQTLNDISSNRAQFVSSLQEIGFIPSRYQSYLGAPGDSRTAYPSNALNQHAASSTLVRTLIAASLHPQISRVDFPDTKFAASASGAVALDPEARTIKHFNRDNGRVFIHPSSTLFTGDAAAAPDGASSSGGGLGNARYISYFTLLQTSKVFVRDLTPLTPPALLMFCGEIELDTLGRGLVVDGWLRLRGWARIGVLVSRLRRMLDEALARKVEEPQLELVGSEVVGVVRRFVEGEGVLW